MTCKNGLLVTHICLDCQLNISDVRLKALDSFDWRLLVFLERYQGRNRPLGCSVIAFLRALVYMEPSGITPVRKFVRLSARDKHKMKILVLTGYRTIACLAGINNGSEGAFPGL